jgi:8-oxo-dGTP diphosphatase
MKMPFRVATLLYCFNERDDILLMERTQKPNLGLWSPCGGKLHTEEGESPHECACREAREEMGMTLGPAELHLTGIISERGYEGQTHWLLFLFEVTTKLKDLPPPHREGAFKFFSRRELPVKQMPQTDVEQIWPLFWRHRGGFFAASCHCIADGTNEWILEETRVAPDRWK